MTGRAKRIEESMKIMFEKHQLNKMASIYKEEEKLEASAQGGGGMRMWSYDGRRRYLLKT
jgi:hypothetical protein